MIGKAVERSIITRKLKTWRCGSSDVILHLPSIAAPSFKKEDIDPIRTYYNAIKSIDNPETGWDSVDLWNKIHGDGKSSTNVLRMQGQLGTGGVHKVRIISGRGKKLMIWLEGMVASLYDEAQIRHNFGCVPGNSFFLDDSASEPICSVLQTNYGQGL